MSQELNGTLSNNEVLQGAIQNEANLVGSFGSNMGGTTNYNDLENKPKINNVTLQGNLTPNQLGLLTENDLTPVARTGSYNDLEDKPTIPPAQVNADWNANSGKAQILNKPAIPTKVSELQNDSGFVPSSSLASVATSGDYDDLLNKPTIPEAQVNSDWDAIEGVAQILNKPNIPTKVSDLQNDSDFVPSSDLSEVAFSGDYEDLHDKPSIASYASEMPISDSDTTTTKAYIDTGLSAKQDKDVLNIQAAFAAGTSARDAIQSFITQYGKRTMIFGMVISGNGWFTGMLTFYESNQGGGYLVKMADGRLWSVTYVNGTVYISEKANVALTNVKDQITFSETVSGTNTQAYTRNSNLIIYYQGESKAHAVGNVLFTLPSGLRPSVTSYVPIVVNGGAYGVVEIASATGVAKITQISTGATGRVYFHCVIPL